MTPWDTLDRMTRRGGWVIAVLLVASTACGTSAARPIPSMWIVQGGWAGQVRYFEPGIAREILDPPSVILGAIPGSSRPITAFAWPSYAWFSDNFRRARPDRPPPWFRGFTAVMYDPEGWEATPAAERRDPVAYFRKFADIGLRYGWTVIITPEPSLMSEPGAVCGTEGDETEFEAYIRCDISGKAATFADVVETQAQDLQQDPDAYRDFVRTTAAQARAANPDVLVVAGITTGREATASQMYAAWASVRDVVDGYYLSIGGNDRVRVALRFLRRLPTEASDPQSG
jgi:hypothetical protein